MEMAFVSMVDSGCLGRGGVREVVHVEPSVCPGIRLGESFGVAFFHAHLFCRVRFGRRAGEQLFSSD